MLKIRSQAGMGMFEVLVALFILAIGVLGFSALQLRAVEATMEANDKTLAMNLARDLAERIRINRQALTQYTTAINDPAATTECLPTTLASTYRPTCTPETLARHDATEILQIANNQGQTVVMAQCQGGVRTCIYVAWGSTVISPNDLSQCMVGGSYRNNAKCIVMEAYENVPTT